MIIALCGIASAGAQTFTQRIQRNDSPAWGTIKIHHSAAIDELVNGTSKTIAALSPDDPAAASVLLGKTYRTNGYRVQVMAGGNSRADKNKVTMAGNKMKAEFPDESVYVHFYTPRWICRLGNYRTYEEAYQMLRKVQSMGYNQATIVKGKIVLKY